MASLQTLDDLRRVIRRIERRQPPRPRPEPIETVVGGEVVDTGEGSLLVVRREYPLDHVHGRRALGNLGAVPTELIRALFRHGEAAVDPRRFVFLDTETTGLAGGTGTYAFLVGAGAFEGDRFVVVQYFMRDLDEEPALLAALGPLLEDASAIVTFNGSGFDVPLLETRFVLARRRWPTALPHLDLLRPARRVWGHTLGDCRLTTLERAVLSVERAADVPGAFIPSMYFAFLRSRQAAPLVGVLAHNRADVLSLAGLLGWLVDTHGQTALRAEELAGLGALWDGVDVDRSLDLYRLALAGGLSGLLAHRVRLRLAWWEKRRARWDHACALWQLAAAGDVFDHRPWEELAKFHEHRCRDSAGAHAIVTQALTLAMAARASSTVVEALSYRLRRLDRRLSR